MICLDCDGKTHVVESVEFEGVMFRKRQCEKCGRKFMTLEDVIDWDDPVAKKAFCWRYNKKGGKK